MKSEGIRVADTYIAKVKLFNDSSHIVEIEVEANTDRRQKLK